MSRLVKFWKLAANDLGFQVVAPFTLSLSKNLEVKAKILVKDFDDNRGMLIFSSYEEVSSYSQMIIEMGYGFSIMEEPREDEKYNVNGYIEILNDWGITRTSLIKEP